MVVDGAEAVTTGATVTPVRTKVAGRVLVVPLIVREVLTAPWGIGWNHPVVEFCHTQNPSAARQTEGTTGVPQLAALVVPAMEPKNTTDPLCAFTIIGVNPSVMITPHRKASTIFFMELEPFLSELP
jgi:hypothetical protein